MANYNYLYSICKHYTKKHHLSLTVDIVKDYAFSCFRINKMGHVFIIISQEQVKNHSSIKTRIKHKPSTKNLLLFALIHEIRHAIRQTTEPEYIKDYQASLNLDHDKRPAEMEADNFANDEIKKWI